MSFVSKPERSLDRSDVSASQWRDVFWLIVASLLLRGVVFLLTHNEPGDPDSRAGWAAYMFYWPTFITSGFWLPLHPYAVAAIMWPVRDPILAGKLLSLVCGVASMIPFYFLSRLYVDRRTSLVAGLLFALYGNHIGLSALVMSEVPFVFLALSGLYFFAREMQQESPALKGFCVAALLLAIAGGFRHEAWQLTGILMLWLLLDSRTRRFVLPYSIIGFSFYGLWTLGNALAGNGVLYALLGVAGEKEKERQWVQFSMVANQIKWAWILVQSPGPLVTLLGFVGVMMAVLKRLVPLPLAIVALLMIAPYWLLSVVKTEWAPQHRYVLFAVILLFPYAAAAFLRFAGNARVLKPALIALAIVTVVGQGLIYTRYSSLGLPVRDYKPADTQIFGWLAQNLSAEDRLVIEDKDWRSPGIIVHTGAYRLPVETVYASISAEEMAATVQKSRANLLILHSEPEKWPFLKELATQTLYQNEEYRVLRLRQTK